MSYSPLLLPSHFLATTQWAGLVAGATDQGWCGNSWAAAAVAVLADRTERAYITSLLLLLLC